MSSSRSLGLGDRGAAQLLKAFMCAYVSALAGPGQTDLTRFEFFTQLSWGGGCHLPRITCPASCLWRGDSNLDPSVPEQHLFPGWRGWDQGPEGRCWEPDSEGEVWGAGSSVPPACLLFPPRSTPTRDTASAAPSPVSTMKSHCCTFFRSTSEPGATSGGACTVRAQVAPQQPSHMPGAGGTEWPHGPRTAPPPTSPRDYLPREPPPSPPPLRSFLFALLGFLPAASGLPGWSTEASIHKALPQAIPPLPIVWEPQLHWALKA